MVPAWQKGIVTRIAQATPHTRRYWIMLPELVSFDFLPGQFVTFDLPIHEQKNKRWRSYSIASAPDGTNTIELVIVYVEGGAASRYFFDEVQEGSELTLRGPQGIFTLPPGREKDLFMICTGTGIAPFRSMLHYMNNSHISYQNNYLLFGTRTQADLLYFEEMKQLEKDMDNFKFIPTLSRENWDGRCGYVHALYEEFCKEKQPAHFMLCGWRNMVDEARQRIIDMGYEKTDIHLELYG